jgi:hypothetical protein
VTLRARTTLVALATIVAGCGLGAVSDRISGAANLSAAPPRVELMVVGRTGTLLSARTQALPAATVTIAGRSCAVPVGTPLAALRAAHLAIRVTDQAGCDPATMYVAKVGPDAAAGAAGWEYKVGQVVPGLSAGDRGARLRTGARLLWFYCLHANRCQRTLDVLPAVRRLPAGGGELQVRVLGYDDAGHAQAIGGAAVHLGGATSVTGADGRARLQAPPAAGSYRLFARKRGLIPSFPVKVRVG